MTTLQQFVLIACVLIQTMLYSQTTTNAFTEKYNPLLNDQNKGVAILLKKDGAITATGLGKHNLTENSVFNIGSATKTFTAILFLQEVEKGNIQLSDPIGNYLSPIKNVDPLLTIEDLLTHQSGLDEVVGKNILDMFFAKDDHLYRANLWDEIEENNPEDVGSFSYCNTNYLLLGRIIEKVTDQSYFDLLRERILEPVKMTHSYPYVHKNLPNLAAPFHGGKDVSENLDYRFFADVAYAAGSIASTLNDMELFYTALFTSEVLLQKESLELMTTSGSESYGLGLEKMTEDGFTYYGHGGNNIGYAFRNLYNPATNDLYLMFSNSMGIPLKGSLKVDMMTVLDGNTISQSGGIDIDVFEDFAGSYFLKEANLTFKIVVEESKMFLVVEAQGMKSELAQKNENSLYDTMVGVVLTRIEDNPNALTFNQNGFETTMTRIDTKTASKD